MVVVGGLRSVEELVVKGEERREGREQEILQGGRAPRGKDKGNSRDGLSTQF